MPSDLSAYPINEVVSHRVVSRHAQACTDIVEDASLSLAEMIPRLAETVRAQAEVARRLEAVSAYFAGESFGSDASRQLVAALQWAFTHGHGVTVSFIEDEAATTASVTLPSAWDGEDIPVLVRGRHP